MIIKVAVKRNNDGSIAWKDPYGPAIRNRLRIDKNLADVSSKSEARNNLGIDDVLNNFSQSISSQLQSDLAVLKQYIDNKLAAQDSRIDELYNTVSKTRAYVDSTAIALKQYVNDAIGYRMTPEQILYYSPNCFGTADAIAFNDAKGFLRIHDLKTGVTPAHMEQLIVYAALFCLEYNFKPIDIECELRLYQSDDILISNPGVDEIAPVMDKIITFDRIIMDIRREEE